MALRDLKRTAHIVPTGAFGNRSMAKGIASVQAKFNRFLTEEARNKAINGFWAEAGHAGTHTDKYFRRLIEVRKDVSDKKSAEAAMKLLWKEVEAGKFW